MRLNDKEVSHKDDFYNENIYTRDEIKDGKNTIYEDRLYEDDYYEEETKSIRLLNGVARYISIFVVIIMIGVLGFFCYLFLSNKSDENEVKEEKIEERSGNKDNSNSKDESYSKDESNNNTSKNDDTTNDNSSTKEDDIKKL